MRTAFFYVRDKNNFPKACIASTQSESNNMTYFTWSVWNPIDKFSKKMARKVAGGRLNRVMEDLNDPKENQVSATDHWEVSATDHWDGEFYSVGAVGVETGFGCVTTLKKRGATYASILSSLWFATEDIFLIPYSLKKAVNAEIDRNIAINMHNLILEASENEVEAEEETKENDTELKPDGVSVPTAVLERTVSK